MAKSTTSTGLLAPEVFIEDMLARGFEFDDSESEEGVLEHPDVPGEAFKFPKNRKIKVSTWVPIKLLVETMQSLGYQLVESGPRVFVLSHPDRKASVVLPGGATELPDVVIRNVLRDEPDALQLMDAVDHHMEKDAAKESKAFRFDLDAALRVLETKPHQRHKLDDATKRRVKEILDQIDAEEVADDAITDASENLDRYVYDVDAGPQ